MRLYIFRNFRCKKLREYILIRLQQRIIWLSHKEIDLSCISIYHDLRCVFNIIVIALIIFCIWITLFNKISINNPSKRSIITDNNIWILIILEKRRNSVDTFHYISSIQYLTVTI